MTTPTNPNADHNHANPADWVDPDCPTCRKALGLDEPVTLVNVLTGETIGTYANEAEAERAAEIRANLLD